MPCPGRGAAFFTMHRRAGTQHTVWTPDQQRIVKTAALHPGNAAHAILILRSRACAASRRIAASGLMVRDGARAPPHHEDQTLDFIVQIPSWSPAHDKSAFLHQ